MIPGLTKEASDWIVQLLKCYPEVKRVIIFGSRAKGNFREGSDIDLALIGPTITPQLRQEILIAYDNLDLPWKLDLVLYDLLQEPALKEHIDRWGVEL